MDSVTFLVGLVELYSCRWHYWVLLVFQCHFSLAVHGQKLFDGDEVLVIICGC